MRTPSNASPIAARVAGALYLSASAGFMLVFAWLAQNFGYPDVLERTAGEVLPQLLSLGADGRAVWAVYALLPLALIPASSAAVHALRLPDGQNALALKMAERLQAVAAVCMMLGLARWSTAQWALATAWADADATTRIGLAATFDALNTMFGNGIGEFVGELTLYGSFLAFAVALVARGQRPIAMLAALTALCGWIGMFRNITASTQWAADIGNVLLPLFLITFGIVLLRDSRRNGVAA
ncbi:hypothetical protein [Gemmatimonas groenlandica]|uniref:DUF4386 family protein n=1 Tax=Gemmatimonas groenlandica TaxID=2732249 RepID=A0A6M4IP96_9BACT|nr:hypothetical protein [Gemmatimonas groenlandica]QJR35559.1 hypothetical protein HKW67_08585 [Gemmatimonas groenlandica]